MSPNSPLPNQPLKVSNEHLDIALNQMAVGFWEVDLTGEPFMTCTAQCKRNFGRDPEQSFTYFDLQDCIIPEDRPSMQAAVAKALEERQPYFAQYRVKHPDGTVRWVEAQGLVMFEGNVPVKIIGTTLDITKVKDLETLRDELLSVAMHELKTPLSSVKGSLQILERHLEKQHEKKVLEVAKRALGSTERITRLLNDMARPMIAQTQEMVLQKTAFDLGELAREIVANTAVLEQGPEIEIITDKSNLTIFADRFRIGQVLTNLLNNAIKYSPGKPQITIHISMSHTAVTAKIADQGLGIAPKDRVKVFQKYYRAVGRENIDGLGIGLYLCSEIVVRHGGEIGIEDHEGPGTTVYFNLPC